MALEWQWKEYQSAALPLLHSGVYLVLHMIVACLASILLKTCFYLSRKTAFDAHLPSGPEISFYLK